MSLDDNIPEIETIKPEVIDDLSAPETEVTKTPEEEPIVEDLLGPVSTQRVELSNAIVKVKRINDTKELSDLLRAGVTTIPAAPFYDTVERAKNNKDIFKKVQDGLNDRNQNNTLTSEDMLTLRAMSANEQAIALAGDNKYIEESLSENEWKQYKGNLRLSRPALPKDIVGSKLTASNARNQLRSSVNMSNNFWLPLYNSGFWINLEAPNDYELTVMLQKISNEKTALGTETGGGVFSNSSCFIRRHIVDYLANKIVSSSLRSDGKKTRLLSGIEVIKYIEITDYDDILVRFMALKHSKGFNYLHTCSNFAKPCNHTSLLTLMLNNLTVHDFSRLTPEQESFMIKAREPGSVTVVSDIVEDGVISNVMQYRAAFKYNQYATIRLSERLDLNFKVPSLPDTVIEGEEWMNSLRKDIDSIMNGVSELLDEEERVKETNKKIEELIDASGVRRYSQWIKSFYIYGLTEMDGEPVRDTTNPPNTVEDRKSIQGFLNDIKSEEELIETFMDGFDKFTANASMTVVGYPQFSCPSCGSFHGSYEEKDKGSITRAIIPLEGEEAFFIHLQG